eukprot:TRINITY_DN5655_c0_g1_i1.p2 TRINITY_DN5655_c0_g1~~TRINITY_DN5655_c0_g1_i1.p2  ORF type:complete len:387 (+),score=142.51 TRINITY_DN5655_c0_g1_i1:82-1161(+)
MILVIASIYFLTIPVDNAPSPAWLVYQEQSTDSTGVKFVGAAIDALIFVVMIVIATTVLVCCFKYRCMCFIYGWLVLSTWMLLASLGALVFYFIIDAANVAVDWITFTIIMWNFSVGGVVCVFWYGPTYLTQIYLVLVSALMAIAFTRIPEFTTWAILLAVAIYDVFAVLCPGGPLRVLVELAQERDQPIPALLYNGMLWMGMASEELVRPSKPAEDSDLAPLVTGEGEAAAADTPLGEDDGDEVQEVAAAEEEGRARLSRDVVFVETRPRNSVKLGLGDFVFYSVLVGRAAMYDIITVVTCFVAILTGLFLTLLLLGVFRKALPALPISIALGTIFYFLTRVLIVPLVLTLGEQSIMV